MVTRNENLKKINVELEQMSCDELEQIAGGFTWLRNFPTAKIARNFVANNSNQSQIATSDKILVA